MRELIQWMVPARLRPVAYLHGLVLSKTQACVRDGVFKGMRYSGLSTGSVFIPKLLGIYERELYPLVEQIIGSRPVHIVNIGAGEGYYAVGLAMRLPDARINAFEMSDDGRRMLTEMALANRVADRVHIAGKCEPNDLQQCLARPADTVVLCDAEGYEAVLLDSSRIPALSRTRMLVELHEFAHPGIAVLLKERFAATHVIEQIWQQPRSGSDFPYTTLYTKCLPRSYLEWVVGEGRPEHMSWLWLKPRGAGNTQH